MNREMGIPGNRAVIGSVDVINAPRIRADIGELTIKLKRRKPSICVRSLGGASSCTVVRTKVDVMPMLTPHIITSKKNSQLGGWNHKPTKITIRVS